MKIHANSFETWQISQITIVLMRIENFASFLMSLRIKHEAVVQKEQNFSITSECCMLESCELAT